MSAEKKTSEREAGKIEARKELGVWLEDHMSTGPYISVYFPIFSSMIKRLKEGEKL